MDRFRLIALTPVDRSGYLARIANHEAQVELERTNNPIMKMTGFVAPIFTTGGGDSLALAPRRLR